MKGSFLNRLAIFSSSQRKGIFILLFLIVVIQVSYYFYKTSNSNFSDFNLNEDNVSYYQSQIDSLKQTKSKRKIFPFNPNFIDDSKGYFLKMKTSQIDKLLAFRKQDKYVNSVKEFQQITGVSDEWLAEYSPYFKFPEWTKQKANSQSANQYVSKAENISVIDINRATKEELMLVKGIGPVFADRIINERTKYNGFVHLDQLQFINGLPPEVGVNLKRYFKIGSKPKIQKININTASKEELSKIPYITYQLSREILIYRSKSDNLLKIEDMKKIKGFPLDKLNIITLYLDY